MSDQVNTILLVIGVLVLGLALVFGPEVPFLIRSSVSPPHISPAYSVKDASLTTNKERQTKDQTPHAPNIQEPPHEEILGIMAIDLQTASEDLLNIQQNQKTRLSQQELYTIASKRVVNLFCERNNDEVSIATGVIIHKDGYILTNAHVTDDKEPHSCLIRSGSPARNYAIAERVFQPPKFSPDVSTRENLARDVAIWKITDILEKSSASHPSLAIHPNYQVVDNESLATFSYPAELLGSHNIVSALYLSFSETTVKSHDAYFIESSQGLGSQKGSSGGILLDPYTGEFAGLIFAINNEENTPISERMLFSLTTFAINEAVRDATGKDINIYLNERP